MNQATTSVSSLVFNRYLLGGKVVVRTECAPGSVTVLQDENGADLPAYEAFCYEKPSAERIYIEFNQKPVDFARIIRIGFAEKIATDLSIEDYLLSYGYTKEEIPQLVTDYELEKVNYLPCAHLPVGPLRIVQLLGALRSDQPGLVMKDPFMPFSGRWREHFAKLLLENSRSRNRVLVCTNLSFVPQTWSQGDSMQYLDVGHAADAVRAQYKWEQERTEREKRERENQESQKKKIEPAAVAAEPAVKTDPQPGIKSEDAPPDDVSHLFRGAYREIQDRIFTPLKEISDFMRSYAAIVVVGCMALMIATMGFVIAPNLDEYQAKLKKLSTDPAAIWEALFKKEEPVVQVASNDSPVVVENVRQTVAEVEISPEMITPQFEFLVPEGFEQGPGGSADSEDTPYLRYLVESSLIDEPGSCVAEAVLPEAPAVTDEEALSVEDLADESMIIAD